jgi:DNA-directed RNA polymerase II subunit RPB9
MSDSKATGIESGAFVNRERPGAVRLRFCPNSNDLLYPKEDRALKKLIYACRNCDFQVEADDHCVFRHLVHHTAAETTTVIQDVRTDPTLPRSSHVRCSRCCVFFIDHVRGNVTFFSVCLLWAQMEGWGLCKWWMKANHFLLTLQDAHLMLSMLSYVQDV